MGVWENGRRAGCRAAHSRIRCAWWAFAVSVLAFAAAGALQAAPQAGPATPVRLALISDTHMGSGEKGERYAKHLTQAVADINAVGVDAILFAGDLTEGGRPEQVAQFRSLTAALKAPVYLVPGNHDVGGKKEPGKGGGIGADSVTRYEIAFGPSFYATVVKGVRVVALNAGLMGSGLEREADEWAFLERELGSTSPMPTVVLLHSPPFVTAPDEPGAYFNLDPDPRARLLALAHQGGVRAILSGHLHRPIRRTHDGTLHLTTPPVAFGLPQGKQPEGWTLVTLEPDGTVRDEFRPLTPAE